MRLRTPLVNIKPLITHAYPVSMVILDFFFISTGLSFVHFSIHLFNHRFPQPHTSIYKPVGYLSFKTQPSKHIRLFIFEQNNKQTSR